MSGSLVLGTAQLGMPYGIANTTGQPDQILATHIIKTAWDNNIRIYDTAQGYGDSEAVLGDAMRSLELSSKTRIVTKLSPTLNCLDPAAMEKSAKISLNRLGVPQLHGLMLHREELLDLWKEGLGQILQDLVAKGITEYIGISVYSPERAVAALKIDGIDFVQLPSNIFDRRFESAGVFEYAEIKKKQIYVRSVFLQGLAVMDIDSLPRHLQFAAPVIRALDKLCTDSGLARPGLALGFARSAYRDANILLGVETVEQLEENIGFWNLELPAEIVDKVQKVFHSVEKRILNPALWNKAV